MHRKLQATKNILGGLLKGGDAWLGHYLDKDFLFFLHEFFLQDFFPHLAPTNKINQKFKIKTDMGQEFSTAEISRACLFFPVLSLGLDRCVF